jgi:hypothetical protein
VTERRFVAALKSVSVDEGGHCSLMAVGQMPDSAGEQPQRVGTPCSRGSPSFLRSDDRGHGPGAITVDPNGHAR